ncbi:glycosyltransferase family 39 protein [Candidatus Saccharibacteria bacterium]|nr:glycosyltransferase family 39 protein [Candidatus Saccharibacteria bacterium]
MSRLVVSRLTLYRFRFFIGFGLLAIIFASLLFSFPLIAPSGLSEAERESAVASYNLHFSSITSGDLVDLPYHILQKLSILAFGFNSYAIKLPSILAGLALGVLIVLLLNRWFKTNVALLASIITVLSTPFLFLSGSGTPLIMLVFWPTFLLWLGSKIQGVKRPRPLYCLIFALALLLSIYTPHLIYLVIFIIIFALVQPHLRFTIKSLPKIPLIITSLIILAGITMWGINLVSTPGVALSIFFAKNFSLGNFFNNIISGLAPFFSWGNALESVFLSPMISLATLALALTGLFSTAKGFFASRNAIASCFIVFAVVLAGLNPDSSLLLILPLAILVAHGLRYLLEKWYGLFPENPYARIFAIFPLSVLLALIIIPNVTFFIYGYRYVPAVANQFSSDLNLVSETLNENMTLLAEENSLDYKFYEVYEDRTHSLMLASKLKEAKPGYKVATLGKASADYLAEAESMEKVLSLDRIITSPKSDNSDRIYIYNIVAKETVKE